MVAAGRAVKRFLSWPLAQVIAAWTRWEGWSAAGEGARIQNDCGEWGLLSGVQGVGGGSRDNGEP